MKVCERREFPGGMGGGHVRVRVIEATKVEDATDGVTRFRAASDTQPFDWTPEVSLETPVAAYVDDRSAAAP